MYARYDEKNPTRKQLLVDHIDGVRKRVNQLFKDDRLIELAALLHDVGKYSESDRDWQYYLFHGGPKIPHTPSGLALTDRLSSISDTDNDLMLMRFTEIIKYLVGAHHGLFDFLTVKGEDKLLLKMNNAVGPRIENAISLYSQYFNLEELKQTFVLAFEQFTKNYNSSSFLATSGYSLFRDAFIIRMYLSGLIDSDWSDAQAFTDEEFLQYEKEEKSINWEELLTILRKHCSSFDTSSSINKIRQTISEECEKSGERVTGIYKLEVPTGGGKTLSVMRFALKHAQLHNKDRIFYIAPYISILEQNAKEYRKVLGKDFEDLILEQHSNIRQNSDELEEGKNNNRNTFIQENWDVPIVLTTMVRLLSVLFSADKTDIRRLHRLRNSVLIIDEFQSMPTKVISLFNAAINLLSKLYNVTVVLCTATQPSYKKSISDPNDNYTTIEVSYAEQPLLTREYSEYEVFKRTAMINKLDKKPWDLNELLDYSIEIAGSYDSTLIILNTRKAVHNLAKALNDRIDHKIFLLSNNMVPAHRLKVIEDIKTALANKEKLVCVSTNLVEAGVDLSFHHVIRSLTGLDSIIQSAGRCNRHGEWSQGFVSIVEISDTVENIQSLENLIVDQKVTKRIIRIYERNKESYANNLLSSELIELYFIETLKEKVKTTHYPVKVDGVDTSIYDLLSNNERGKKIQGCLDSNRYYAQAIKTAANAFKVIDSEQESLLVPYGKGKELIGELLSSYNQRNKSIWKELQRYSISVYPDTLEYLRKSGEIIYIEDYEINILKDGNYNITFGLDNHAEMELSVF